MSNTDDYGKFPFTFLFHRVSHWHQEYEAYKSESRSEAVERKPKHCPQFSNKTPLEVKRSTQ